MENNKSIKEVGLFALVCMIIGSTIGSGVFTITGDMASGGAYTGAIIIGWVICGVGIFCLLQCFSGLTKYRPDLENGIYSYAREGFGEYAGFISAYGYWISGQFTSVSYMALLFGTLNYFIPVFTPGGNNMLATILGLLFIWACAIIVLRGVSQATILNLFTTFAKIIPLFVFIIAIIVLAKFDPKIFMENFWGAEDSLPISQQVMATTKATIWSFIGIEGSVVLSKRAKRASDVNKSTFIGFASILFIYVAAAMLSLGVVPHDELASLDNPQMAGVLSAAIGPVGEMIVRIGIILSIVGASLGWAILSIECPAAAADDGVFPKIFGKMNSKGTPYFTLLLTTCIQTFFMILGYFSESAYLLMYNLCVSMIMIPYLLSAAFYLKAGLQKRYFPEGAKYGHAVVFGILGTLYGIWMIYSGGLNYMLVTTIMYTPGLYIFFKGRQERGAKVFDNSYEKAAAIAIAVLGVISLVLLVTGKIVL